MPCATELLVCNFKPSCAVRDEQPLVFGDEVKWEIESIADWRTQKIHGRLYQEVKFLPIVPKSIVLLNNRSCCFAPISTRCVCA